MQGIVDLVPGDYVAWNDIPIGDELVVHTAHSTTSELVVPRESQLRAGDHPLTEFVPDLATLVARTGWLPLAMQQSPCCWRGGTQ